MDLFEKFPNHPVPLPGLGVDGSVAVGDRDAVVEADDLGNSLEMKKTWLKYKLPSNTSMHLLKSH